MIQWFFVKRFLDIAFSLLSRACKVWALDRALIAFPLISFSYLRMSLAVTFFDSIYIARISFSERPAEDSFLWSSGTPVLEICKDSSVGALADSSWMALSVIFFSSIKILWTRFIGFSIMKTIPCFTSRMRSSGFNVQLYLLFKMNIPSSDSLSDNVTTTWLFI